MKLIPALDILDNRVVRLTQGDYLKSTVYSDDPVEIAVQFKNAGVQRLHLVDLSGARAGSPVHAKLFGEIKKSTGCMIEAGGGVRSLNDFELFFEHGLKPDEDLIMVGSLPFKDPKTFEDLQKHYLKNILLTVDVWDRNVKVSGWEEDTNVHILDFLEKIKNSGLDKLLVTQIKRDGMLSGPDVNLYKEISERFDELEVIVSGGISGLQDVSQISQIQGVCGFIVGRAFYEGKITLDEIRKYNYR
ncbi:MAG: HisA/HisF-related TIM barrel protein [Spirochaetia bacterium]|nr:HisA/HisF-related TIM barrel protein [Spirochaetia bacterium]